MDDESDDEYRRRARAAVARVRRNDGWWFWRLVFDGAARLAVPPRAMWGETLSPGYYAVHVVGGDAVDLAIWLRERVPAPIVITVIPHWYLSGKLTKAIVRI